MRSIHSSFLLLSCCLSVLSYVTFAADDQLAPHGGINQEFHPLVTVQGHVVDIFADPVDDGFTYLAVEQSNSTTYVSYMHTNDQDAVHLTQSLIGCEVSITGLLTSVNFRYNRRLLQKIPIIDSLSAITLVSPARTGPYDIPTLFENSPTLQDIGQCGTRKLTGIVVARWRDDSFLILDSTGDAIKVRVRRQQLPDLGQTVEAVGQVATDLYRYNLMQAQWRPAKPVGIKTETTPRQVNLSFLFRPAGRSVINSREHGRLIKIHGRLQSILTNETGHRRLLLAEDDFKIVVDCSAIDGTLTLPKEGTLLEASGICVFDSENWQPGMGFPKVNGLFVVPRTAGDIVVLEQPPWWTPARFVAVVVSLLAILVGILIWNASLRVLVARKSRALLKEQAQKLSETLKVDERTRLAAELHDFHSQNLTAIAYQISAARNLCADAAPEAADKLATAAKMLKSCRTDLRRCLWDLRNDTLNQADFAEAIRQTVAPVSGEARLIVRFTGRRAQISDSTAHALLCILRELCANAVNHGHANTIRIAGESHARFVRFSVQDNGCGFDPTCRPCQEDGHFGLDGVQERLNRLNGKLDIESSPGRGTYVRLTINHAQQDTPA